MRKIIQIALIIIAAQFFCLSSYSQQNDLVGTYRRFTPIDTGASDIPNLQNATLVNTRIYKKAGVINIDWSVTAQPPGYILSAVSPAKANSDGSLTFVFTDAWGNKGKGSFRKTAKAYLLKLILQQESDEEDDAASARSLYDEWELDRIGN